MTAGFYTQLQISQIIITKALRLHAGVQIILTVNRAGLSHNLGFRTKAGACCSTTTVLNLYLGLKYELFWRIPISITSQLYTCTPHLPQLATTIIKKEKLHLRSHRSLYQIWSVQINRRCLSQDWAWWSESLDELESILELIDKYLTRAGRTAIKAIKTKPSYKCWLDSVAVCPRH